MGDPLGSWLPPERTKVLEMDKERDILPYFLYYSLLNFILYFLFKTLGFKRVREKENALRDNQ